MPLFIDVPAPVPGATGQALADAHSRDPEIQNGAGVEYQRYWFSPETRRVFSLVGAPSAQAAAEVHRRSHGLTADEIIEVVEGS